jgi:hypothetical protein
LQQGAIKKESATKVDGKVVKVPASGELYGFMAFLKARYARPWPSSSS